MIAVAVLGILAAIAVPMYESAKERARKAQCISNLRTIHTGLLGYTSDHGHWPQMDPEKVDFTEEEFFGFWMEVTEPYGLGPENWICPSDRALERMTTEQKQEYFGSYVVTRFDDKPQTPFRWNQPWVLERGNFHGDGAHMLMPDGSVQSSQNPFYGR